MTQGYVALVLHAHLPFVRHAEHEDFLEERWLYEAITECYLPLLDMLERLEEEAVPFRFTLSMSPTLMAMLDDTLLRRRCLRYLEASLDLAEREVALTAGRPDNVVAQFYLTHLSAMHQLYLARQQDLLTAFHRLARAGYLELITCAATHGFLPLHEQQPQSVRAQIQVAVAEFRRRFGHPPRGFWLPECGYFPGLDQMLRQAGIQYFVVDTHALTTARPTAPRATFAHGWTPAGVAAFGRDVASSKQVWSANEGYPGDAAYREFYRDIGFDRDPAHLGRLAGPEGVRTFTGFKYHRITGPTEHKELYDRWSAERTAIRHAAHFVRERERQVARVRGLLPTGDPPLVVAPYDAELFGHWWFEGPYFLEQVARSAVGNATVRFLSPGDYLDRFPTGQGTLELGHSSWGYRGYADFWCDGANHWVWRHLHGAGRRMADLARRHAAQFDATARAPTRAQAQTHRALNQALRELLLAQASDWPFIMQTGTAADYARRRFTSHLGRFRRIEAGLSEGTGPDPRWLAAVEAADNLFPEIDFRVFV